MQKFSTGCLKKQIQEHIKLITYCDQMSFIWEMQWWFNTGILTNVIQNMNKIKNINYRIASQTKGFWQNKIYFHDKWLEESSEKNDLKNQASSIILKEMPLIQKNRGECVVFDMLMLSLSLQTCVFHLHYT